MALDHWSIHVKVQLFSHPARRSKRDFGRHTRACITCYSRQDNRASRSPNMLLFVKRLFLLPWKKKVFKKEIEVRLSGSLGPWVRHQRTDMSWLVLRRPHSGHMSTRGNARPAMDYVTQCESIPLIDAALVKAMCGDALRL
jgi:hypothetical protein